MLKAYGKFLDILEKIVMALIVVSAVIMCGAMFYQVIMRYFFSKANAWSEELSRLMCIWMVMLGASIASRRNSHLQIDVFINLLPKRMRYLATAILTLISVIFIVFLFKYSVDLCLGSKSASAGLKISRTYIYMCIPVGMALMFFASLEVIIKNLEKYIHYDPKAEEQSEA